MSNNDLYCKKCLSHHHPAVDCIKWCNCKDPSEVAKCETCGLAIKVGPNVRSEMKIDFEQFLMEKHAEDYVCTDDMMPDAFADWVQDLEADDVIRYGNLYAEQILTNLKG